MNYTLIMTCAAGFLYALILLSIPFRRRKVSKNAGQLVMKLKIVSSNRWIMIAAMAAILIVLVPFRMQAQGLFICTILEGCAVVGMELAARDAVTQKHSGIYENMLVASTQSLYWSEILGFPTLSYEDDEETTQVDRKVLQVLTQDGTHIDILFYDEAERQAAVEKILEVAPQFKVEK